jgi:hypothetical protein
VKTTPFAHLQGTRLEDYLETVFLFQMKEQAPYFVSEQLLAQPAFVEFGLYGFHSPLGAWLMNLKAINKGY